MLWLRARVITDQDVVLSLLKRFTVSVQLPLNQLKVVLVKGMKTANITGQKRSTCWPTAVKVTKT